MRPEELKDAVKRNIPVIMAAGVGAVAGEEDITRICPIPTFSGCQWHRQPACDWIRVAGPDLFPHYPPGGERMPVGHGSKGETQLMMGSLPESVRMDALATLDKTPRWLEDATEADDAEGKRWIEFCVQGWGDKKSGMTQFPQGGKACLIKSFALNSGWSAPLYSLWL